MRPWLPAPLTRRTVVRARRRTMVALVMALTAATLGLDLAAQRPAPGRQELPFVKVLGAALSEFDDRTAQVVAAYYYAQRNHDGPWILIELGFRARRRTRLERHRVEIETPSGDIVPLSGQRRWGADGARAARLLQQVTPTRHQVRGYFGSASALTRLRFFARPEDGHTVVDAEDAFWDPVLVGDLLFESPTGAWESGRHLLVIGHEYGVVRMPLDLR